MAEGGRSPSPVDAETLSSTADQGWSRWPKYVKHYPGQPDTPSDDGDSRQPPPVPEERRRSVSEMIAEMQARRSHRDSRPEARPPVQVPGNIRVQDKIQDHQDLQAAWSRPARPPFAEDPASHTDDAADDVFSAAFGAVDGLLQDERELEREKEIRRRSEENPSRKDGHSASRGLENGNASAFERTSNLDTRLDDHPGGSEWNYQPFFHHINNQNQNNSEGRRPIAAPRTPSSTRRAPPRTLNVIPFVDGTSKEENQYSPSNYQDTNSPLYVNNVPSKVGSFFSSTVNDDLQDNELDLKWKKAFVERVIEQHENLSEQKRRNDILQLCERLQGADLYVKPHQKSSRIKTNGSLPREKGSGDTPVMSPLKPSSSFDDIHQLRLLDNGNLRSHNVESPASKLLYDDENLAFKFNINPDFVNQTKQLPGHSISRPSDSSVDSAPLSPSSIPGSPRRGIKTVLPSKDALCFPQEITHEVLQGHPGLVDAYNQTHHTPKTRSTAISTSTPREQRPQANYMSETSAISFHSTTPHSKYFSPEDKKYILPLEELEPSFKALPDRNGEVRYLGNKTLQINSNDNGAPSAPKQEITDREMTLSLELEFVQKEKLKIMSAMTVLKGKLNEIENLLEESQRELAMEQAFINAELKSKTEKVQNQKEKLFSLQDRGDKCQIEIDKWQENRNKQQKIFNMSAEKAETKLFLLEEELKNCQDETARRELEEKVYNQMDVVDSQKKLYEDLEFKFLEEESVLLAKKEELNRDLTDAINKYDEYVAQVCQLESLINPLNEPNIGHLENFREQKNAYLLRLEEGQSQLDVLDARIEELQKQGAVTLGSNHKSPAISNVIDSPNGLSRENLRWEDTPSESRSTADLSDLDQFLQSIQQVQNSNRSVKAGEHQPRPRFLQEEDDKDIDGSTSSNWKSSNTTSSWNSRRNPEDLMSGSDFRDNSPEPKMTDDVPRHVLLHGDSEMLQNGQRPTSMQSSVDSVGLDVALGVAPSEGDSRRQLQRRVSDRLQRQQRPLTRYLPIRGTDLDLRQHIETAGHCVSLCDAVSIDSTTCRGVLQKASARFRTWQKRWFVFDRSSRTFTYHKSRRDDKVRGGVYFQSIVEVYVDHMSSQKNTSANCVFVVKTKERTYHLMAPTPEAMRIWVDVIFTGAEGYQEFD